MVNMTVINIKDIMKYLVKIIVVIATLTIFTRYFFNKNSKEYEINPNFILYCINSSIPGINTTNNENTKNNIQNENYKIALNLELESITAVTDRNLKNARKESIDAEAENSIEQNNVTEDTLEEAETNIQTEVVETNYNNKYTNEYNGVFIKNETSYNLTTQMLTPTVSVNTKNILLFHTHTCESYTASESYAYEATGNYRTTDLNYTVARVGDELANYLTSYGYNIIHDKTYHDYPAYSGSYGRSLQTVSNLLNNNQNTDIVFDIHRDAVGDNTYAPKVKIGDEYAAQIMFVVGTDGGGLEHQNWIQNLQFAIKIQEKANELYPGLFKPIMLRNSRYNQHLAKGASIIEVGATGNTMEECLTSMKYLSKVIDEVLKEENQ